MEDILSRLSINDTNVAQQATTELKEAFKNPESTIALFQLITTSENPTISQYAAVLLRKRYSNRKKWFKLPDDFRTQGKNLILQGLVQECESNVKKAIAQLIGTIVKHEMLENSWPQVLQVIQELVTKADSVEKELGIFTLATITEVAPSSYLDHADSIMAILAETMNSLEDTGNATAFYVLQTMLHLIPLVKDNQDLENAYEQMMPQAMSIVPGLAVASEERATAALELFDELCEQASIVVRPHVDELVALCLTIARDSSHGEDLRFQALSLLETLIRTRKRSIVEHKLDEPIIELLYELMSTKPDVEHDEDYFTTEHEEQRLVGRAAGAMLYLARRLKPEELTTLLLERIKPVFEDGDVYAKKTSYLAMTVLAEGCSEHIQANYLLDFLQYVLVGVEDENAVVRNAALHAAGHFSESLQPEISRYSDKLLPILLNYLDRLNEYVDHEKGVPFRIDVMFRALDAFWAFQHDDCLPYLPILMQRLIEYLNKGTSSQMRLLVIGCIGETAKYVKEDMLPYFPDLLDHLLPFLTETQPIEMKSLQLRAIQTLGLLLRYIGDEELVPVLNRALELGLNLIEQTDDSDVKCTVYNFFTNISVVLEQNMAACLSKIVHHLLESIQSLENIVDGETEDSPGYEDVTDMESEGEENIEVTDHGAGSTCTDSGLMETEKAMIALRHMAEYSNEAFLPYYEKCFETIFRVVDSPHKKIWSSAINTLDEFCVSVTEINTEESVEVLLKMLSALVPKYSDLTRLNKNREKAARALAACKRLLLAINQDIGEDHRDAIINSVMDIWSGKTACQVSEAIEFRMQDDEEDRNGADNETNCTNDLYSNARDVILALQNIIPREDFALHYEAILTLLQERLKASSSKEQRSCAVEMIGLCIPGLEDTSVTFVDQLLALFNESSTDESAQVRRQAFRGLGELVVCAKNAIYSHYDSILSVATMIENDSETRGYMVALIAKMIITNYSILDMDRVFPWFVDEATKLQFKEHVEHYCEVFESVLVLYRACYEIVKLHLQDLLTFAFTVFYEYNAYYLDDFDRAPKVIEEFIASVHQDCPDLYNEVQAELPPEVAEYMLSIVS